MNIRIVSPSGAIAPEYIDGAAATLRSWGCHVSEGRYARMHYGRFAGTPAQRVADLQEAIDDPQVDAILCSRGGYGLAQIADQLDWTHFGHKIVIGFSDITVLHSALAQIGVPSLHSIMAKHLSELAADAEPVQLLRQMLFGKQNTYHIGMHPLNRLGVADGVLRGGNLSVLYGLRGTPLDLPADGRTILFIEDIAERPYHIDRMMQNLRMGGVLAHLSGLLVGQFSDCPDDPLMMRTVYQIIADAVAEYHYPVCFDFPAGHVPHNLPLWLNKPVQLCVTADECTLCYPEATCN